MMNINDLDFINDYSRGSKQSSHKLPRGWSPLHSASPIYHSTAAVASVPSSPISQSATPAACIQSAPSSPIAARMRVPFDDDFTPAQYHHHHGQLLPHYQNQHHHHNHHFDSSSSRHLSINTANIANGNGAGGYEEYDELLSGRSFANLQVESVKSTRWAPSPPAASVGNVYQPAPSPSPVANVRQVSTQVQQWLHSLNPEECANALQTILQTYPYQAQLLDILDEYLSVSVASANSQHISPIAAASAPAPPTRRIGVIGQHRNDENFFSPPYHQTRQHPQQQQHQPMIGSGINSPAIHSPIQRPQTSSAYAQQQVSQRTAIRKPLTPPPHIYSSNYHGRPSSPTNNGTNDNGTAGNNNPGNNTHSFKLHAPKPRVPPIHVSKYTPSHVAPVNLKTPSPAGRKSEKGRIPEAIDMSLLEDVPAWLRSLRLHKYNNVFYPEHGKKYSWQEMVALTDRELEKMGVGALGARRKLLKVFDMVKNGGSGDADGDQDEEDGVCGGSDEITVASSSGTCTPVDDAQNDD